ncbi:hypothetical protein Tco_0907655 [Tanacetum coccineum]|uniref:Retrovirus-related Pol polyprotein from transposon TNT 1-94-like beta-barrel domain-containing protein n=1 Tax=Tanacetum coccineum TaxID=301880 RepID=A0ABQ5CK63_9ASTR
MSLGIGGCVIKKSQKVIGQGYVEDEASHYGDVLSSMFQLSLMKERPVKKVVLDETIGFLVSNEQPELIKVRARGWYLLTRYTVHVCNSREIFVDYQSVTGHEVVLENNSPVDVVSKLTQARARGWYLLTRCTVHVCNSYDMFVDYQPVTGHEVVLEDNSHVNVVGYGTVKLQLTTGNVLTLNNVFHMPAIVKCCISMNKLIEMGLGVAFHGEGCYVNKSDQIVGNGFVEDGMFCLGVIDERSGGN